MNLDRAERSIRWLGALAQVASYLAVLMGITRGLRHRKGRVTGIGTNAQRLLVGVPLVIPYLWLSIRLWRPIVTGLTAAQRVAALVAGSILYFSGLALLIWGRYALGELHNVSSVFGVELYEDHRLIQSGPFRFVRHPMYLGWFVSCLGALLIYRTWTVLFIMAHNPVFVLRAKREEAALAAQFGEEWVDYCRRAPAWLPRIGK